MKLQTELKDVYERSLYFVTAIEHILAEVHQTITPEARGRVKAMSHYVNEIKDYLGLRQKAVGSRHGSRTPLAMSPLVDRSSITGSVSPSGKRTLKHSVMESYKKLMRCRAGRSVFGEELEGESSSLNRFRSFESESTQLSNGEVLPHYNLLTGKVERLDRLPSFDQYLGNDAFSLPHASTRKVLEKVKDTSVKIEAYYNSMKRLAKHVHLYGVLPDSFDTHQLDRQSTRVSKVTIKDSEASKRHFDRQSTRVSKMTAKDSEISKRPLLSNHKHSVDSGLHQRLRDTRIHKPEEALISRRRSFRRAILEQDQDLSAILTRIDRDRPSVMREKVKIVHMNSQAYKDSLHTLSMFNGIRKVLERDRVGRRDRAIQQMKGYLKMCEFFRFIGRKPSPKELRLMETVKLRLEEGLSISPEDFEEIVQSVGYELFEEAFEIEQSRKFLELYNRPHHPLKETSIKLK